MWLAHSHTKCFLLAIPLSSSILPTHTTHTVTNLKVVNITTNSTTITWNQPPHNYRVFLHGEATDNIPQSRVIQLVNVTGQTTHIVEGLNSFRNYSISVYLESKLGQGSSATVTFQTQGRGESAEDGHASIAQQSIVQCSAIYIMQCARQYVMHVYKYYILMQLQSICEREYHLGGWVSPK